MRSSSSLDPKLLLLASGLLLAAFTPGAGCSSGESTGGSAPTTSGETTSSTTSDTGGTSGTTTSSSTTTGSGGSGGTSGSTSSSTTSTGDSWPACHTCLQGYCDTELAACDDGCIAIQACLDAVCGNLSVTGASDEGACQVYCQTQHFGSKQAHLDLVNCAQGALFDCGPPCAFATYDWDQCVKDANKNACKAKLDACTDETMCTDYLACALTCTNTPDCKACSSTPEGKAGRALYEDYWVCVETGCIAEAWLPHF